MLFHSSIFNIITHNPPFEHDSRSSYELSDFERDLINLQSDAIPDLQARLECLSDTVNSDLRAAIDLQRLFDDANGKTMYVTPYVRSIIHAAANVDIQYISSYPLAVNPCLVHDPLLRLLPHYSSVTGIACVSVPFPIVPRERPTQVVSELTGSDSEVETEVDFEDSGDSDEALAVDVEEWLEGSISSSSLDDDQTLGESLLDYSLLARLTCDISEDTTPLALVCIARSQDLYSAMASCLYQRWAWGITEPLMGIVLDDSTCSVRIVFGRLLQSVDDPTCFTMHVVHGAHGPYDLATASDAKHFASLVANACRRFTMVSAKAMSYTSQLQDKIAQRKLNIWRLDQIGLVPSSINGISLQEKIASWRRPSESGDPEALSLPDLRRDVQTGGLCSLSSSAQARDMDARPVKKFRKMKSEPTMTSSIQEDSVQFITSTPPTTGDGAVCIDVRSASSLAAGRDDPDKTSPMKYWLYNHLAVPRTLAFPAMLNQPDKYTSSAVEKSIAAEYYFLTTFSWVDDNTYISNNLKALPLVKATLAAVAQVKLLAQLGQSTPYVPLTGPSAEVLISSLSEIISVLEDIQRLRVGMDQASELECHHHIDRLMMKFFHGHKDGTATELSEADYVNTPHVMVSLQRSLALPRGYVAHIADSTRLLLEARMAYNDILNRDFLDIVTLSEELGLSSFPANPTMVPDPVMQSSLRASTMDRTTSQHDVNLIKKASDLAWNHYTPVSINTDQITVESLREPEQAVCDSVGYVRFPSIFTSITASSSFNIIQTSKSRAPSRKCRSILSSSGFPTDDNSSAIIQGRETTTMIEEDTDEGNTKDSMPKIVQMGENKNGKKADIDVRRDLFLPIISAQHKRLPTSFATSVNQGRLYATASIRFYAAMGIYDVGVYTIVSEGSILVVTVSYAERPKSTLPPLVNILERNTVSFDLADLLGLLNFVTFLIKLRVEYVPQVLKRVESVMGESSEGIAEYLRSLQVPTGGPVNEAQWRHYRSKQ